ncbi:MAG: hypothetical protein ACE5JS_20310 [Nitrospinota bacterium]
MIIAKGRKLIATVGVLGAVLFGLGACETTPQPVRGPKTVVSSGDNVRLVGSAQKPVEIGAAFRAYQIPFSLASVPNKAVVQIEFGVVSQGLCPVTYVPTTISVNDKLVKVLDFRLFKEGQEKSFTVDISRGYLKKGENTILIHTGLCQYDIDVMRLNDVTLLQR